MEQDKSRTTVIVVYILYLIGFATGISALAGVILANARSGTDEPWQSHIDYQIRTFWLGLATLIVGGLLTLVLIGYLVLFWWMIWTAVRSIKGLSRALDGEPIEDPQTMLW